MRKQDGPHQTLRWRRNIRNYKAAEPEQPLPQEVVEEPEQPLPEEIVEEPDKEEKIDATTNNIL